MKNKQVFTFIIIVFLLIGLNNTCFSINKEYLHKYSECVSNIEDEYIKIKIKNIDIINKKLTLEKTYSTYIIVTINISNLGLNSVELSNINCYAFQQNKKLETFIQSKNNYLGFIGDLSSGEEKDIKLCVALDNTNQPVDFIFENVNNESYKVKIENVNLELKNKCF